MSNFALETGLAGFSARCPPRRKVLQYKSSRFKLVLGPTVRATAFESNFGTFSNPPSERAGGRRGVREGGAWGVRHCTAVSSVDNEVKQQMVL